jgi:hypothetical protein
MPYTPLAKDDGDVVAGADFDAIDAALTYVTDMAEASAAVASLVEIGIPVTDESTVITSGTSKFIFRMPFAMTVTEVRASLETVSSSGVVTVDINENGTTIIGTKLTIDANEKTSLTAATPPVISDTALADDAEITIDVDTAGTGAVGLKVWIMGSRT